MTLVNMRTTLREMLLAEGSSSIWEDATLNRFINLSQLWVAKNKPWRILFKAKYTTTTSSNYYDLPSDYLYGSAFFVKVDDEDYNWVDEVTFRDEDFDTDNTYTIHGSWFFVYPTPSETGLQIDMWYIKRPTTLSNDSDESVLQEELHEAILQRALYLALKRDKNTNAALEAKNDANEIIRDVFQMDKKSFRGARTVGNALDNFPNYNIHK